MLPTLVIPEWSGNEKLQNELDSIAPGEALILLVDMNAWIGFVILSIKQLFNKHQENVNGGSFS